VRDAVTEEIFKGADRTEEKIAGQEFERLKFKGGRSMVASRRSEGSHLRCPWKYKIGQLLKNRISRVIPGADYWFVKFLLVYAAYVPQTQDCCHQGQSSSWISELVSLVCSTRRQHTTLW
jgi:hypothetical protein